MRNEGVNQ